MIARAFSLHPWGCAFAWADPDGLGEQCPRTAPGPARPPVFGRLPFCCCYFWSLVWVALCWHCHSQPLCLLQGWLLLVTAFSKPPCSPSHLTKVWFHRLRSPWSLWNKALGLRLFSGSESKLPASSLSRGAGRGGTWAPLPSPWFGFPLLCGSCAGLWPWGRPCSSSGRFFLVLENTTTINSNNKNTHRPTGFCLYLSPINSKVKVVDYKIFGKLAKYQNFKIIITYALPTQIQLCLHCAVCIHFLFKFGF